MKARHGLRDVEQCIAPRPDSGRVVRRAGDLRTASRLVLALAQRAVCSSLPITYSPFGALQSWRISLHRHDHDSFPLGLKVLGISYSSRPHTRCSRRCYFPASAIVPRSRLHLTTDAFVSFRPLLLAQSPLRREDATNGCLIQHSLCDPATCGAPC
jgi:hypothetical protein